jgi:hypothetical protein
VAVLPGVVFGGLATAIQVAAVVALKRARDAPLDRFMRGWGLGMALRVGGVVAFLVVVSIDRELFPPEPTAFAYLGVLIPLLFTETRFIK